MDFAVGFYLVVLPLVWSLAIVGDLISRHRQRERIRRILGRAR